MSLLHELKRRSVFRVGVAYVVVAWLVLQVVGVLAPIFSLPDWVGRFVVLLIAIGFPFAVVFAWAFEVTPEGVKLDKGTRISGPGSTTFMRVLQLLAIAVVTVGFSWLIIAWLYDHGTPDDAGSLDDMASQQLGAYGPENSDVDGRHQRIAVLPFDDMSPGGGQAWLADGLAEDLLDLLSKIDGLRVIARTSSFALRGQDIAAIGESLGAGSVVEGSVRRSGEKLRVTAQLIRVSDQTHLWSDSYDRTVDDVFKIQREIATAVASAIGEQLGLGGNEFNISSIPNESVDFRAWELVKLANQNNTELTKDNLHRQIDLCNRALEIEPGYARAYSCISSRSQELWRYGLDTSEGLVSTAKDSTQRVLATDPDELNSKNLLRFLELGTAENTSGLPTTDVDVDLTDIATLSYVFAYNGDTERAARIWIDASPSSDSADARRRAYEERGYAGLVDSVIDEHADRSGSACTEDPAAAAFLLALLNEEERMFGCIQEAATDPHSRNFFRLHPVFEPYRANETFGRIVDES